MLYPQNLLFNEELSRMFSGLSALGIGGCANVSIARARKYDLETQIERHERSLRMFAILTSICSRWSGNLHLPRGR
jgi:hypothetical protein